MVENRKEGGVARCGTLGTLALSVGESGARAVGADAIGPRSGEQGVEVTKPTSSDPVYGTRRVWQLVFE